MGWGGVRWGGVVHVNVLYILDRVSPPAIDLSQCGALQDGILSKDQGEREGENQWNPKVRSNVETVETLHSIQCGHEGSVYKEGFKKIRELCVELRLEIQ